MIVLYKIEDVIYDMVFGVSVCVLYFFLECYLGIGSCEIYVI